MSLELIYTSAPKGIKPGSSGFCTVAMTQGMPAQLIDRLEALSGYRQLFAPQDPQAGLNPVVCSHLHISVAGRNYHVLSRVGASGLDYSQRANKFAYHVALDNGELPPAGPAWLLAMPGYMASGWDQSVRLLPPRGRPPNGAAEPAICRQWQQATGDAGWGGAMIDALKKNPRAMVTLIFRPGTDPLPLVAESLALLPPNERWATTFSTYFTKLPAGVDCRWRCVVEGSPEAKIAAGLVVDLSRSMGQPPPGEFVTAARTGQIRSPAHSPLSEKPNDLQLAQLLGEPAAAHAPAAPVYAPSQTADWLDGLQPGPPSIPAAMPIATHTDGEFRRKETAAWPYVLAILAVGVLVAIGVAAVYFWKTSASGPPLNNVAGTAPAKAPELPTLARTTPPNERPGSSTIPTIGNRGPAATGTGGNNGHTDGASTPTGVYGTGKTAAGTSGVGPSGEVATNSSSGSERTPPSTPLPKNTPQAAPISTQGTNVPPQPAIKAPVRIALPNISGSAREVTICEVDPSVGINDLDLLGKDLIYPEHSVFFQRVKPDLPAKWDFAVGESKIGTFRYAGNKLTFEWEPPKGSNWDQDAQWMSFCVLRVTATNKEWADIKMWKPIAPTTQACTNILIKSQKLIQPKPVRIGTIGTFPPEFVGNFSVVITGIEHLPDGYTTEPRDEGRNILYPIKSADNVNHANNSIPPLQISALAHRDTGGEFVVEVDAGVTLESNEQDALVEAVRKNAPHKPLSDSALRDRLKLIIDQNTHRARLTAEMAGAIASSLDHETQEKIADTAQIESLKRRAESFRALKDAISEVITESPKYKLQYRLVLDVPSDDKRPGAKVELITSDAAPTNVPPPRRRRDRF